MPKLIFHEDDGYYSFDFDDSSVIAAFSNKRMNMAFHKSDHRMTPGNREIFALSVGFDYRDLVCLEQVHGDRIAEVSSPDKGKGALEAAGAIGLADGAITAQAGVPVSIRTADCLPLFFYDQVNRAVGIAHAGHQGALKGIAKKIISLLRDKYGTKPADILVGMGPALRVCCYEVTEEFKEYFPGYVEPRNGKLYFDLVKANRDQLLSSGVKVPNIIDSGLCTACLNDKFFSWRREKTNNRVLSVIMLK
ncbi:MAG: peptidoglycan editing factor PgeF [bacterium]